MNSPYHNLTQQVSNLSIENGSPQSQSGAQQNQSIQYASPHRQQTHNASHFGTSGGFPNQIRQPGCPQNSHMQQIDQKRQFSYPPSQNITNIPQVAICDPQRTHVQSGANFQQESYHRPLPLTGAQSVSTQFNQVQEQRQRQEAAHFGNRRGSNQTQIDNQYLDTQNYQNTMQPNRSRPLVDVSQSSYNSSSMFQQQKQFVPTNMEQNVNLATYNLSYDNHPKQMNQNHQQLQNHQQAPNGVSSSSWEAQPGEPEQKWVQFDEPSKSTSSFSGNTYSQAPHTQNFGSYASPMPQSSYTDNQTGQSSNVYHQSIHGQYVSRQAPGAEAMKSSGLQKSEETQVANSSLQNYRTGQGYRNLMKERTEVQPKQQHFGPQSMQLNQSDNTGKNQYLQHHQNAFPASMQNHPVNASVNQIGQKLYNYPVDGRNDNQYINTSKAGSLYPDQRLPQNISEFKSSISQDFRAKSSASQDMNQNSNVSKAQYVNQTGDEQYQYQIKRGRLQSSSSYPNSYEIQHGIKNHAVPHTHSSNHCSQIQNYHSPNTYQSSKNDVANFPPQNDTNQINASASGFRTKIQNVGTQEGRQRKSFQNLPNRNPDFNHVSSSSNGQQQSYIVNHGQMRDSQNVAPNVLNDGYSSYGPNQIPNNAVPLHKMLSATREGIQRQISAPEQNSNNAQMSTNHQIYGAKNSIFRSYSDEAGNLSQSPRNRNIQIGNIPRSNDNDQNMPNASPCQHVPIPNQESNPYQTQRPSRTQDQIPHFQNNANQSYNRQQSDSSTGHYDSRIPPRSQNQGPQNLQRQYSQNEESRNANQGFSSQNANQGFSSQNANQGFSSQSRNQELSAQNANQGFSSQSRNQELSAQNANEGFSSQNANEGFSSQNANQGFSSQSRNQELSAQNANEGFSSQSHNQGFSSQNPNQGFSSQNPNQGFSSQNPNQGFSSQNPNQGFSSQNPNQGFSSQNLNQGFSSQNPGDQNPRNFNRYLSQEIQPQQPQYRSDKSNALAQLPPQPQQPNISNTQFANNSTQFNSSQSGHHMSQSSIPGQPIVIMPGFSGTSHPSRPTHTNFEPKLDAIFANLEEKPGPLFAKLRKIAGDVFAIQNEAMSFNGRRGDREYIIIEEMLTRQLLALDGIQADGVEEVRLSRRSIVRQIQGLISTLEQRAKV